MIKLVHPKFYNYFKNSTIYLKIIKYKALYRNIVVSRNSDFVIEGFPRSANTFATSLVYKMATDKLVIARHMHSKAQLIKAYIIKFQQYF